MNSPPSGADARDESIADLLVRELLDAIAGRAPSPGAGAAGAVTLGLAAACAGKAVAISLKHRADSAGLRKAGAALHRIGELALIGADRDAQAFEAFIREHDPAATTQLLEEGSRLAHLIRTLRRVVGQIESEIEPSMAGDLIAAYALADAAHMIQSRNQREVGAVAHKA